MKRVAWRKLLTRAWVTGTLMLLIGNSIYKYGEIRLSPEEIQVRKIEMCLRLGFPQTARFILEGNGRIEYNAQQLERVKHAAERIDIILDGQEGR
jgi:hypothetical protein